MIDGDGVRVRLIMGSGLGRTSPVPTATQTVYADIAMKARARLPIDAVAEERALYLVEGAVQIASQRRAPGRLLVLRPGGAITVEAVEPARLIFLGGQPMDGPRHFWWNFVSSRRERIEQAKADWKVGRFTAVPGDAEYIPLPDR